LRGGKGDRLRVGKGLRVKGGQTGNG
jgi:hypothetical protein